MSQLVCYALLNFGLANWARWLDWITIPVYCGVITPGLGTSEAPKRGQDVMVVESWIS